jgi:hypothetical protein
MSENKKGFAGAILIIGVTALKNNASHQNGGLAIQSADQGDVFPAASSQGRIEPINTIRCAHVGRSTLRLLR